MSAPRRPDAPLRLCVVSPCHNEAEGIARFVGTLGAVLDAQPALEWTLLLVDDGSTDGTLDAINALAERDPRVVACSLSRNFGHQVALTAGLDAAEGDAVLLMDSDLQHPPLLVPRMLEKLRAGADVVSAVRLQTRDASWFKRASADAFYALINRLSETPVVRGAADFVLLSAPAHAALRAMPERHRFLRGMVSWIGFRREFVPFEAPARASGRSSYTLRRMLGLGADALFSFSTAPVRLATRLGLAVVGCGVLYLGQIAWTLAFEPQRIVPGWSSLMLVVLLLGGTQLVLVGLVGEYVARIFEESKGRPLYLFKQPPAMPAARARIARLPGAR